MKYTDTSAFYRPMVRVHILMKEYSIFDMVVEFVVNIVP